MENESKYLKVLLLLSGLMLCLAVIPAWPYGYYALLRLVICGVAGYAAYTFKNNSLLNGHVIPLVIIAILFNPIVPVSLDSMLWLPIDLGAAVYFLQLSKKI